MGDTTSSGEGGIQIYSEAANPNNKLLLTLVIALFIIIILFLSLAFYFVNRERATVRLSEEQMTAGVILNLSEGSNVRFTIINESHSLKVDSVNENSVDITINSNTIRTNISVGEEKRFDLNNDSSDELSVELNSITEGKPRLTLAKISQLSNCVENWLCSDWGACNGTTQNRTCSDSSICGTTLNKPSEIQNCSDSDSCREEYLEFAQDNLRCANETTLQLRFQLSNCSITWKKYQNCSNTTRCYIDSSGGGCRALMCSELNGSFCNISLEKTCRNNSLIYANDTGANCCMSECVNLSQLTCAGNGGTICPSGQVCSNPPFNASDTNNCCRTNYGDYCTTSNICTTEVARVTAENNLQTDSFWGTYSNLTYINITNTDYWSTLSYSAIKSQDNYLFLVSVRLNQSGSCTVTAKAYTLAY